MFIVVRKSQASVKKIFDEKKSLNEIIPHEPQISLDVVQVSNHYEKTTAAYNRIYYIHTGQLNLYIKNQTIELQKGDACFVEKGTTFELVGTFEVIIVSHSSIPFRK